MIDFEVYRGPESRIVAISKAARNGQWTIKVGTQGSRLRISTWAESKYPTLDSVKADALTSEYAYIYTGQVDTRGNPDVVQDAERIFWSLRNVQVDALRRDVAELASELNAGGTPVDVRDDASGLVLSGPSWEFAISAHPHPNGVNTQSSVGSGQVFLKNAPALLVLLCDLASRHPLEFAGANGTAVSMRSALDAGSRYLTPTLAAFLKRRGLASLSVYLRSSTHSKAVRF
jgi:hypothetical protein